MVPLRCSSDAMCYTGREREIMLFIGKPKGRSKMISNIPVASSSRRRALRNRSKRRGESTDPCTVPVSSCMGLVPSDPTCTFIHELLNKSSRKSTSGTPSPRRITQRQECPAELKAFLKSKSIGSECRSLSSPVIVPSEPFVHHLYSAVCSKTILGAFHYRTLFREFPESARDYNINQLIYGVQECYGSVVVKDGTILVLMDKDYFRHQQVQTAV